MLNESLRLVKITLILLNASLAKPVLLISFLLPPSAVNVAPRSSNEEACSMVSSPEVSMKAGSGIVLEIHINFLSSYS